ncbi:MAG TPA: GNAT family protein [Bacteroidia bacterium]|nr:GNAT family protein [Bacteroidia bacterium]
MLDLNFHPFPELSGQLVRLRMIDTEDVEQVFYLRSSKKIMKYIEKPLHKSHSDSLAHINLMQDGIKNNTSIYWAVCSAENPTLLGIVSYHFIDKANHRAELGYILNDNHWGKGFTNDAVSALINFGFSIMDLHSIEAKINPDNVASKQLLLKHHFKKEAYFRENYYYEGKFLDTEVYSLLKSEARLSLF